MFNHFIENYFKQIFIAIFIIIGYLNQNSSLMDGILPYYLDFSEIVKAGFNPEAASMGRPTFPMWGYGFLFLLSEDKFLIYLIQSVVAIYAVFLTISYADIQLSLSRFGRLFLRMLILVSFSWMSIHNALSPYSLSISLTMISVVLFCKSFSKSHFDLNFFIFISLSAICAGVILNLRSDYMYFFGLLPLMTAFFLKTMSLLWMRLIIWYGVIFVMMLPWINYTHQVTGKSLLTSTNSGHVLFIGLGQLPNNVWGIQGHDGDPRMHEELKMAGLKEDSLVYDGDKFLKSKFFSLVINNPTEYIKKSLYAAQISIISGIYVPEFYMLNSNCYLQATTVSHVINNINSSNICRQNFILDVKVRPISSMFASGEKFSTYLLTYTSIFVGIFLHFLAFIALPFALFYLIKDKNVLLFICVLIFIYQLLINSLAFQMKLYSTYSYFSGLLIISYVLNRLYLNKYFLRLRS